MVTNIYILANEFLIMFNQIIKDIKDLKIQGAENVAKSSITAIIEILNLNLSSKELYVKLLSARIELEKARSTEPCLRNTLTLLFYKVDEYNFKEQILKNINIAKNHFELSNQKIAEIGANKIKEGMVVFTHCHSSAVMNVMKKAKSDKIRFSVKNTETRPLFQGRITAKELSSLGISIEHFIDSAGRLAVKSSDLVLLGADAITVEGYVINKIGSEMFCETAKSKDIPVYICTDSWKFDVATVFGFDEVIEKRHKTEVWSDKPKDVKISNYAFEKINPELVTGIISELGIYSPQVFIEEVKRFYPWMFESKKQK